MTFLTFRKIKSNVENLMANRLSNITFRETCQLGIKSFKSIHIFLFSSITKPFYCSKDLRTVINKSAHYSYTQTLTPTHFEIFILGFLLYTRRKQHSFARISHCIASLRPLLLAEAIINYLFNPPMLKHYRKRRWLQPIPLSSLLYFVC